jgi:hypothetical protein
VLLLNAVLTVRAHSANSHKDQGWEQLTDAVVKHISDNSRNVVFLLWGSYAQKKVAAVDKVLVYIWSWKVHVFSDGCTLWYGNPALMPKKCEQTWERASQTCEVVTDIMPVGQLGNGVHWVM